MPSWSEILNIVNQTSDRSFNLQQVRQRYLSEINKITGRNVISYYSGWLKNPAAPNLSIDDQDKNAFMNAIHKMDRTKGLDLILHTPGGDIAATESIVTYLKMMFNSDIRAIIPQISMSAGTMIAMSCREIIMGEESSLGPIDPQMNGVACQAVVDEFYRAVDEVKTNPASLPLWSVIISKYHPTFITACDDAVKWSASLAETWLKEVNPKIDLRKFKDKFLNHKNSYSHSRHISKQDCKDTGLNIVDLESDQKLQEAVLSLHHSYMITIDSFTISKIIENQIGACYIQHYSERR